MHEMGVFWLRVATVLYAAGLVHAMVVLLRKKADLFPFALAAFHIAVVLHVVAVVELTMAVGHLPVDNFYETSSICALLIAFLFLFVNWRYEFSSLSVCIFPLVFVMAEFGCMEIPVTSWPSESVRNAWLMVHIVMILLGYAGLLLTAVASIFYLIQERQLKSKRPGTFFDRLPPLATLDGLVTNSMGFGFVFITLGVIAGSVWAFIESGTHWITEPRIALSFVTWGFYLMMVFLRASAGWRGRKAALMAIAVLCCSALTWAAHAGLRGRF
jgi:ABC-type transport system involved in cytochrome c biogenesis permease subunit